MRIFDQSQSVSFAFDEPICSVDSVLFLIEHEIVGLKRNEEEEENVAEGEKNKRREIFDCDWIIEMFVRR